MGVDDHVSGVLVFLRTYVDVEANAVVPLGLARERNILRPHWARTIPTTFSVQNTAVETSEPRTNWFVRRSMFETALVTISVTAAKAPALEERDGGARCIHSGCTGRTWHPAGQPPVWGTNAPRFVHMKESVIAAADQKRAARNADCDSYNFG